MHRSLPRSVRRLVLGSWLCCAVAPWAMSMANADEPGIAKTKPAQGPAVAIDGGFMVPYKIQIPGTNASFEMIPIPGGKYKLGSPEGEKGREASEGPQVEVELEPFWMGKTEVTWSEYGVFMKSYGIAKELRAKGLQKVKEEDRPDAITIPTPLYEPSHTFEYGDNPAQPAVTMTQYAAKQYTKWLSGLLGQQYRLPSEAEWEYAARAGSNKPYSFGDDVAQLKEYACFAENNEGGPAKVGTKKPNGFGLFDMHGNAWEWTLDQFSPEGFKFASQSLKGAEAVQWPTTAYPRTCRGGGWQDGPEKLRSASRLGADDEEWKSEDPNIPLSPWWYTTDPSRSVGFRLLRSKSKLSKEAMEKFWQADCEDIKLDVETRLQDGRGVEFIVTPEFAKELEKAK